MPYSNPESFREATFPNTIKSMSLWAFSELAATEPKTKATRMSAPCNASRRTSTSPLVFKTMPQISANSGCSGLAL